MRFFWYLIFSFFLVCSIYAEIPSRNMVFDYELVVKGIPADVKEVNIWIPFLPDTPSQFIEEVNTQPTPDGKLSITYDPKFQNKMWIYNIKNPKGSSIQFRARYKVKRYEILSNSEEHLSPDNLLSKEELEKFLLPNRLVTISPRVKVLAAQITEGKDLPMAKAKAIYDYVYKNMQYDKTVSGWGQGNTERACDIQKGNCTDFHSMFISLARASAIPAKFMIGVSLDKDKNPFKSYHCWAAFYIEDSGWIPVDISEAWKTPSKKEYFFGSLDENRIVFTEGRDLLFTEAENKEPLNYFIYPYVEIDGETFSDVEVAFRFKNTKV